MSKERDALMLLTDPITSNLQCSILAIYNIGHVLMYVIMVFISTYGQNFYQRVYPMQTQKSAHCTMLKTGYHQFSHQITSNKLYRENHHEMHASENVRGKESESEIGFYIMCKNISTT
mgnify:FL=1